MTEPLVTALVKVEAVGGEGIAKWADGTVIATDGPCRLVAVSLVSAQVDHAAGAEVLVDNAQDTGIAKGGVTDNVSDEERGVEGSELEELSGERDL